MWPDERQPDCIVAVVSGATDASQFRSFVGKYLPSYMMPRSVHAVEEMPLNASCMARFLACKR